jgi:hypothetical protein
MPLRRATIGIMLEPPVRISICIRCVADLQSLGYYQIFQPAETAGVISIRDLRRWWA